VDDDGGSEDEAGGVGVGGKTGGSEVTVALAFSDEDDEDVGFVDEDDGFVEEDDEDVGVCVELDPPVGSVDEGDVVVLLGTGLRFFFHQPVGALVGAHACHPCPEEPPADRELAKATPVVARTRAAATMAIPPLERCNLRVRRCARFRTTGPLLDSDSRTTLAKLSTPPRSSAVASSRTAMAVRNLVTMVALAGRSHLKQVSSDVERIGVLSPTPSTVAHHR
jgi:hypothetical protein